MDINRKLELVTMNVRSISTHDDVDAAVRLAALDRVDAMVAAERKGINDRVQAEIGATLPKAE